MRRKTLVQKALKSKSLKYKYADCYDLWYDYETDEYYYPDYANPIEKSYDLMPTLTITTINDNNQSDEVVTDLFDGKTLYSPAKMDQKPLITTVSSFDISDFSNREFLSVLGNSETVYSSTNAVYFVSTDYPRYYNWNDYQERTSIYKINILDNLEYRGKTFVDGTILSQFSLSEYNDILRIATTTGWSWQDDTDNIITTIGEVENSEDNISRLQILDQVSGLGKVGESIFGVRFMQNRGYVVTFRQTDPLYILDFSNPKDIKLGENPLEISGYSTYFHKVNDNLLLSIGVDANGWGEALGYQIQLFDVSDIDNPALVDKKIAPENAKANSYWDMQSEAIDYNEHKAFTYRESDNIFGFPLKQSVNQTVTEEEFLKYEYSQLTQELLDYCKDDISSYRISEIEAVGIENYYVDSNYDYYNDCRFLEYDIQHKESIYFHDNIYLNYASFELYSVNETQQTIEYKTSIEAKPVSVYWKYTSDQRGIIFSREENNITKDYGLYFTDEEFILKEITSLED